ncbi:MAG TPA: RDD family protein [Bryobacteraceae bacterium]|jgi:uncharacterized RDD family membrane protein YckC|nr:RDD family protein [Bryobacteraceae bacterium]
MTPQSQPAFCSECGRPTPPDQLARFGDRLVCPYCKDLYAQKLREGVAPAYTAQYAGFWIRFVAYLIEVVILLVVESVVNLAIFGTMITSVGGFTPGQPMPMEQLAPIFARMGASILTNTVITAAYYTFFVGYFGATPGKLALGLQVVRPNGAKVGYGRALGRYFASILSAIILGIGYLLIAFDSEKRGLHDMICDTRVVKTRV